MDAETKGFYQGWAVCASFIAGPHMMPTLIGDAIREHGVTLKDLREAGADSYDIEILRPLMDKRFSTYMGR